MASMSSETVCSANPLLSFWIWPPSASTRACLVDRISSQLSTPSIFSQRYGAIDPSQAAIHAKRIEESAFNAASLQATELDASTDHGVSLVQFYAKEVSKLMLDCLKSGGALLNGVSPAAHENKTETAFDISGGRRDFLTKEMAEELLKPLSSPSNTYLKICLSNWSFGLDAAKVAENFLSRMKAQLQDVNLADIVAGRQEAEALSVMSIFSSALEGSRLRSLNLSDNALGEKGVRAFSSLLKSQNSLEELYFMNNGVSEEAAQAICELLPSGGKLRILHFHNNMSGDGGAVALAQLVRSASGLEDFRFSSTRVGTEGGIALAEALLAGSSLKKIDLRDNPFGVEGGLALAKAVGQHLDLVEVYLSYLGLEDEATIAVAKALTEGAPGLRVLELAGNDITEKSARVLADCLASKSELKKLSLAENELRDRGVVTVCEALLKGHDKLMELDLSSNEISRIGAAAAAKAVAQKSNFKVLNIDGNRISEAGILAVKEVLSKGVCGATVLGSLEENEEDEGEQESDVEGEEEIKEADEDGQGSLEKSLDNLKV